MRRSISLFVAAATLIASTVAASAGMPCPRDMYGNRIVVQGCGYNNGGYGGGYYVQQSPQAVVGPNGYYRQPSINPGAVAAGAIIGGVLGAIIAGSR
jgi:hypothetical protein